MGGLMMTSVLSHVLVKLLIHIKKFITTTYAMHVLHFANNNEKKKKKNI